MKPLEFSAIEAQLGHLEGKILTIIDASYSDERQLNAVKGLVKKMFREQRDWIGELCGGSTKTGITATPVITYTQTHG